MKEAVHDDISPATAEPCHMYLNSVGFDLIGAPVLLWAVTQAPHEPTVIHLKHVHINLVVSDFLQMLHAVDDRIKYSQPLIDFAFKNYRNLFHLFVIFLLSKNTHYN